MNNRSPVFLGVDGGGTGSRARLRDVQGRLLAEGTGGPANIYQNREGTLANLRALITSVSAKAGVEPSSLRAGFGLAGLETSVDPRVITAKALGVASAVARVDAHTACLGAFGGEDGGIVVAGTGSIAYGILGNDVHLFGGWGLPIGDQGAGGWLGLEAIKRTALVVDGLAPETPLSRMVTSKIGKTKLAISSWTEKAHSSDYGTFSPGIFELATKREESALAMVQAGALEISRLIKALTGVGMKSICLVGGLAAPYRPYLASEVSALLQEPKADAAEGAIQLAMSHWNNMRQRR
jgi:glucosamine kinase